MYEAVGDTGLGFRRIATGSQRDSRAGKGRFDLIPPYMLFRLARHYENGAAKYGDRNWEKGQPLSWFLDSAFRHLAHLSSLHLDEDHAAAIIWNISAYMDTLRRIQNGELAKELDDVGAIKAHLQKAQDKENTTNRKADSTSGTARGVDRGTIARGAEDVGGHTK